MKPRVGIKNKGERAAGSSTSTSNPLKHINGPSSIQSNSSRPARKVFRIQDLNTPSDQNLKPESITLPAKNKSNPLASEPITLSAVGALLGPGSSSTRKNTNSTNKGGPTITNNLTKQRKLFKLEDINFDNNINHAGWQKESVQSNNKCALSATLKEKRQANHGLVLGNNQDHNGGSLTSGGGGSSGSGSLSSLSSSSTTHEGTVPIVGPKSGIF